MSKRQFIYVLLLIFVGVSLGVGLAVWENSRIKAMNPHPPVVTVEQDRDSNPKPVFKTKGDRLTAEMDLTYCWFATFTNETTGLSHTLHNAYDKDGKACHH